MPADRFKYFRIEARELLDGLTRGVLDLEKSGDGDAIARMLRHAHTLKGAARIVGHRELSDLAHEIEDVLASLRSAPSAQRLDRAIALVDRMSIHVAALPHAEPESAKPSADPRHEAAPPGAGDARASEPAPDGRGADAPAPRADPATVDDVLSGLAEIHALVRRLRGVDDRRTIEQRVHHIERELRAVRHDAERLRLLPAGTSFTSLELTARDVARSSGKRVAFTSSGGEVRVDAHVLTTLHAAVVQLVRNAVAHGIEPPDERVAAGKPADGRVSIAVALRGSRVAITCRDDGRGLDLEAVRRSAVRRGLAPDRARSFERDQLIDLLLRGGITTTTEVTPFAGRGIGLDVVREAAQLVGGEVTARSDAFGTAFTIVAPTSVAAVSALVLTAGDRVAGVPLAAVRRVARVTAGGVMRGPDGLAVALDDVTVPFAPLSRLLGGGGAHNAPRSMVIVDSGGGLGAIGADHVLGIEDVVVRALPDAPIDPVVWGVALDPEGVPRPILEPAALVAAVRAMPAAAAISAPGTLPVLVIDDSLTTRMLEQSILESAGYEVELASSAEDGLAKLGRRSYGLILVDVEMPGVDGFEFISKLRSQPQHAGIPVILVTSRNRPDDLQRGTAVGAQGYMVKGDFDQTKLLAMIRRLVGT